MTKIQAHRGSAGTHPENTFFAFIEAERVGADGIELDVQLTKDGEIVVIHDKTIDRTTNGSGKVNALTLEEIQTYDAGSWFDEKFTGAKIPTLRSVLEWFTGNGLHINIELKNDLEQDSLLAEKVVQLVEEYELAHRTMISSFNHVSMNKVACMQSGIETAIIYLEQLYKPWKYAEMVGADSLHAYYKRTDEAMITHARENGYPIRIYTINTVEDINTFLRYKPEAIITDFPERAIQLRSSLI